MQTFQSRCWLELRCNAGQAIVTPSVIKFQSRCWLELRCNFGIIYGLDEGDDVSEQMLA